MNQTWQEDYQRFKDEDLPLLKQLGHNIGRSAEAGDEDAKAVVSNYRLLRSSFDPLSAMILREALNRWVKKQEEQG